MRDTLLPAGESRIQRAWAAALLAVLTQPVSARSDRVPLTADLIHSDLPLFGDAYAERWPQHFTDKDGDFGCSSPVAFGIWQLKRTDRDADEVTWYRFANYGVFHCAALVSDSSEREAAGKVTPQLSFFVQLKQQPGLELWALQRGVRPGSDYLFLRRTPETGVIKRFDVLQAICPQEFHRKGPPVDIFLTGYCSINTQNDLLALARRMVRLPPLGTLTFVER